MSRSSVQGVVTSGYIGATLIGIDVSNEVVLKMKNCASISVLMLWLVIVGSTPFPTSGQQWVLPRTPHGQPDLQGNWTNATLTPFERREGQEPVLTPNEVAVIEARQVERRQVGSAASDPTRPPPAITGQLGASYNEIYYDRGDQVARVNGEPRASLLTRPYNGRRPALTPDGDRRRREMADFNSQFGEFDNPENRPLVERCVMFSHRAGPPMIPNGMYNKNYTIVQGSDYVMIHAEMAHDTRIVRLGEPKPLADHIRPWMGDSWGRWDGNTLVVETTNIHPGQEFRGLLPSGDLKVMERFTRVDEETIHYEFTIEDPTTYTEPWGGEIPFKRFDQLLYEFSCHEGNYAIANVLSGARYQESQVGRN